MNVQVKRTYDLPEETRCYCLPENHDFSLEGQCRGLHKLRHARRASVHCLPVRRVPP